MKDWPFGVVLWGRASNRRMLHWLKTVVVSDTEKAPVEAPGEDQGDGAQPREERIVGVAVDVSLFNFR
jgi:hypothetical protein